MPKAVTKLALLLYLIISTPVTVWSKKSFDTDTVHQRLYQNFLSLYSTTGEEEAFYASVDALCDYYYKNDLKAQYYKMKLNLCLYDTENNHSLKAMRQANEMLEEMESEGYDAYSQVYLALGTIYENRGNYRMARYFYEQAHNSLPSDDDGSKMAIFSRLAYLQMFRDPIDAKYWNDKYEEESLTMPDYHQVYLFINTIISFAVGDQYNFEKSYAAYQAFHNSHPDLDNYGMEPLGIAQLAFDGKYQEAIDQLLHHTTTDLNNMSLFDMRTHIYKMMKRYDLALETATERAEYIDSLNSDMLFTNLNELNAQTGLANTQSKAAQDHLRMLIIVLVLAIIVIVLLMLWLIHFRQSRKELSTKNEQLHAALSMAEEGEKMKTEFVRSVSHEIRTPLNAINGFNDVLNTPGIELSEEERADLVKRIRENVQAITNIVDEMLRMADKASNDFNPQSSKLFCNQFFSSVLYKYRNEVSASIELNFTTTLLNRMKIETNEEGVRKIMQHLIQNAIKFTREGSISVHCEQADNGNMILVSVTDTGRGISKEQQSKIFERFYKADAFDQGIGLGLTVSKKIAQKLGGDLTLDDSYTGGARFVLSLPISS